MKILPGVLGALVALRFLPAGASWGERIAAFAGGLGCAIYVAPAIAEWSGVSSHRLDAALVFVAGLFGMATIGELMRGLRDLGMGALLRAAAERLIGGGGGTK